MKNCCDKCDGRGFHNKPGAKWWEFFYYKWCMVCCAGCGGDGYAKPPGWPDQKEIDRLRPPASPAPPRPTPPRIHVIIEGHTKPIDPKQLPPSEPAYLEAINASVPEVTFPNEVRHDG